MDSTGKKTIHEMIKSLNWDDKEQLNELVSNLCQLFNENNIIEGELDDEGRIIKLNNLYNWCNDLYDTIKENCDNPINTGSFWNSLMDKGTFYEKDKYTKELCRCILGFFFIKCNDDNAKIFFDKSDDKYLFFKKYVIEGVKEIYANTSKTDMTGFENEFTRLRSHISMSMLADSFNTLHYDVYQERGCLEMFVTILDTLQNYARGQQRKEIAEGIHRLIDNMNPDSHFIPLYEDYLEKYSS